MLNEEIIKRAMSADSADELISIAKESGIDLSSEGAARLMENIKNGELSDEVLENASGGCGEKPDPVKFCPECGTQMTVYKKEFWSRGLFCIDYRCPVCKDLRTYLWDQL